jgi:hypothetical protein
MPRATIRAFLLAILPWSLIALTGRASHGELIYFRNGSGAQLPARLDGNRVVLVMPDGNVELVRSDLSAVVPGFWPETEWVDRKERAREKSAEARLAEVWWAIENGLTLEAADELRAVHAIDPKLEPAKRIVNVLDRLNVPCKEPDFERFQKALGIETRVARGPHIVLLHQHSDAEAEERIALIERVIAGFFMEFAADGLELSVPRERLVSAWFADRNDYLKFLKSEGAMAFATTRGYFHPTWNAVMAYDPRSDDSERSARAKLAARREEVRQYRQAIDRAPPRSRVKLKLADRPLRTVSRTEAGGFLDQVDGEITAEYLLLDLDRRSIDLGTAAHETVHQLMRESGLVRRHDDFPVWLQEGLAAQFEVIHGGRWAGISRAHDLRLPDWRSVRNPLKLERLVRNAGFGHGYDRDLYAQAWALVYFLRTQHRREFLTFIDLLRVPGLLEQGENAGGPERVSQAFQRAFGSNWDGLEAEWRKFMGGVQTPLEKHAPKAVRELKIRAGTAEPKR